jgi:hypothetical protein
MFGTLCFVFGVWCSMLGVRCFVLVHSDLYLDHNVLNSSNVYGVLVFRGLARLLFWCFVIYQIKVLAFDTNYFILC